MKGVPYESAYTRKQKALERKRAQQAVGKLHKQRGASPSPERDRHWDTSTKTTKLFDPSVKKVDIFRIPKRKPDEKNGKKTPKKKEVTAQQAIASAIESILRPNQREIEEENIENIMNQPHRPPPLSDLGEKLSVAVPSPRMTDVVRLLEASTSPIDENILQQMQHVASGSSGYNVNGNNDNVRSSREYLDDRCVKLHSRETELRNATKRVMIRSPDGVASGHPHQHHHQHSDAHSMVSTLPLPSALSPRNSTTHLESPRQSPRRAMQQRQQEDKDEDEEGSIIDQPTFTSPHVKSQVSRRKHSALKVRVDGINALASSRGGGMDWNRADLDLSLSQADMNETMANIRKLRQVSGSSGMSLGHLQDNLVLKLQDIYRTHDDAMALLSEVDERRDVLGTVRAGSSSSSSSSSSLGKGVKLAFEEPRSPNRPPREILNVRLPADGDASSRGGNKREGAAHMYEYYDATHLPSYCGGSSSSSRNNKNEWMHKPTRIVDTAASVLHYSKSPAGQGHGNIGASFVVEPSLDEEGRDTLFKFASAYQAPTSVPSVLVTHETAAGWRGQGNDELGHAAGSNAGGSSNHHNFLQTSAPRGFSEQQQRSAAASASSGMGARGGDGLRLTGSSDKNEGNFDNSQRQHHHGSKKQSGRGAGASGGEESEYLSEAFRQKRLAAVRTYPRLDANIPLEMVHDTHTYLNDLHFMQGVRSAAFGARGVSMKFCMDRATDMILKETIDKVANEIDLMLGRETELLVGKI